MSRELEAEVLGRAKLKHERLIGACDDASDAIVEALSVIDRVRILKLARAANYTSDQCEEYILERTLRILADRGIIERPDVEGT